MAAAWSPAALSGLIGSIYDCALDPSRWQDTLANIKDTLDSANAILSLSDLRKNCMLIDRTVGIEPYWMQRVTAHLPEIHAVVIGHFDACSSFDEPHVCSRHLPPGYMETSPYIQECWKEQGIVDVTQYFLMQTPTRFAGFAMGWHERHGIVTDADIERAGLLLPHVRRAVMISDVLDVRTIERAHMAEALNALRCAVVIADARGSILHANGAAEHMLRNGGAISDVGGVLQANSPTAAAELRAAIDQAARDETGLGKAGLAILLTGRGASPVFAHVLPLTGSEIRTRLQPSAAAAVFISTVSERQGAAEVVATAFGLTPAETRVLAGLLAGHTLAETAASLGIAVTTARKHLDSIFAKTGVARQADLMRLGVGIAPPVG